MRTSTGLLIILIASGPHRRGEHPLPCEAQWPAGNGRPGDAVPVGDSPAAARGYQVVKEVIEIASGLNDKRPQFQKLLSDGRIGGILVEHKDRATRSGYNDIACLLEAQKRRIEAINATDTQDELVDDFVALITSMAARIYGRRSNKRRAEAIRECVERVYEVS